MKRVLSLLLVLVMLVGLMPTTALATGTGESAENPWSGRSAVFVGDSITAGDNAAKYYRLLEQSLDLGSVTVMGVGGSCFSAYSDYGTGNQPLINRYQNIPSTDLIMVFMGTNDYGHETPLGSVEDTQDGTFYGALNTIIPALVAKHTASKIVFVTPLHRYGFGTSKILGTPFTYDSIPNGVGATLGDYVDALKTVCANNGVSVIDLHTECTLDPSDADIRAEYMPDGIHPSAAGHAVIAGIMESHLRTFEPVESEPVVLPEMIQGNKFASTSNQPCRASSRINYYLKAGTVITLNDPDVMQWACARTSNEFSSNNLGYFPDSQWTDKVTAVVAEDGWIGFTFKYRDETQSFDLTRPLSDYITIHTHSYSPAVTAPTCTEQGYTTYTCQCDDSYVDDYTEATGHSYENSICTGCGDININWEIGTIAAASGANASNTTRLRTTDYLALADFSGVSVNVGYQLTWLAYDAEKNYIGNGTSSFTGYWQPSGQSIATADIQNLYSNAVYFRLALKAVSGGSMTLEDVQNSCVTFIPFGEALPEPEYELEYESSLNIGSWQDGAIWNGKLFVLGGSGTGAVYDLEELCKLATFSLDSADVLKPHANSVCFGSTYYAPGDEYPLLYVNIYNNYASAEDRMEGTCCAYRISKTDGGFATELVQVIEIGFTEDLTLWKSMENNGDVRPYGNFLVDTEANKLYAYVMRDATNSTRFFKFDLPELTDGIYSETYGCNVVTLESADIERQFDTEYFNYLQGGTYSSGMILSAEGFNSGSSAEPAIRIIDLQTGTISATYYMANSGLTAEPEVVCVDPTTGLLYYAPADGILRILSIPDVHFHGYTSCVISPTCTEQGYTTYTCECGDSYVDDYTEATGHSYENGICAGCGATASPYLQQLPEDIIGCTNLYDSLVPVKGYYTATKYDTSNGAVLSVVIPVEPGDRISASSFGPVSENMGSANGIRVTYLLGDKIVASLSAGEVYSAYTANGYITVPDGVDAVCVPWWVPGDSNWLTLSQISKNFAVHIPKTVSAQAPTCTESGYTAGEICEVCNASLGEREEIPPTGHTYGEDACTVCGAVNLRTILGGKYVSVLGDSISTFNGYSNDATVNTTIGGNGPRYDAGTADTKPGSFCLLESVDQTWWMHFADRSGMKLLVNNSWAGSQVFGGQTGDGRVIPAAYLDRCVNLHDNTLENNPGNAAVYPDVIFVYLGINDYNFNRSQVGTGTVDYSSLVSADGTYVTPATFGEAYGIMLHKMRNAYPDAQIFAMTLLPENLYSVDKTAWEQHNTYIRAAAEYYNIPVVDLAKNCAITWENYSGYMIDKIHPTTAGMKLISDCIEAELVTYYTENPPHTHSYTATVTAPTCTEQGYTTYTCECGDSYVDDYTEATGHTYENSICTGCGVSEWDTDGDGVLEILAIGNSFSVDALQYAYQIAQNLGIEEIAIGNLYIGGCTLETHAKNAAGDLGKYTYYYNDNGTWTSTGSYKISTALESRSWDYVSMQQGSPVSGVESSYNEDLTDLIAYVQDRSDAKLVWHMTWAYQQNSTHSAFPTYNKDQITMYNAIVSAVQNKIVTNENFELIVPNGTAVQNSRTSLLGDTTTRDGYHMSYDYGRYLTGLLFIKTVTGLNIDSITYAPSGVDAEEKAIAIESVSNAAAKPFAVTKSKHVNEVPDEGYILLQTPIYQGAFWHPQKDGRYNELIDDQSNSPDFFTTIRFTRETLPVGSIIVLESGWQYRSDGWVTDTLQTGTRESATTKAFQIVTEEWWRDYSIRSFNVSRTSGGSVMDLTEEDMRSVFQIYVPEEKHFHDYVSIVTAPTCTEQGYTTYTCTLCGDSYVGDYVDASDHTYENGICTGCGEKLSFKGKTISILGDSISTYTGVSNDSSVNATLKGGAIYYNAGTQDVYRTDTWWQQTIDALSMELLVNNSWSGSAVLHTRSGTAGAYVDRCVQLHNTARDEPDVIVVFLGTNDFSYYQSALGTANIDYSKLITDNGDGTYTYATPKTTCEAYAVMLHKMVNRYPDAEVYCMNLLPRRNPDHDGKDVVPAPTQFNGELAKVISHFGCTVVDLENCGITPAPENFDIYITDQRVHPGPLGMDKMTQALIDTMMGMEDSTFAVSQNLVNVTANVSGGIVLAGGSFNVALTPAAGFDKLTVTVTMGGKDVTASVYSDGMVNIPAVTDNVVITASAAVDDIPNNYYWEISGNSFVNVAKNDLSANALTKKAGSITDGVTKSAYFQLEKPVVLRHNLPWIVEWRVSGTSWTGMLLSGNTNSSAAGNSYLFKTTQNTGFIGFGEAVSGSYHNYGIALASQGIDLAAEHTYRVENRIAADGSNMVYLLVDGKDYGPMNHYYIGGNSNQGKQVDWLNGRDLCFFYIGSNGHPLNNCQLDYLSVTECNHTYENGICTGCGEAQPGPVITQQPIDAEAKLGERYMVEVLAEGDDLKYQWYFRNAGASRWNKSSVKDNTYDDVMTEKRAGREVYCVITDANGNSVKTDTVMLICLPSVELAIVTQPTDGEAVLGERYCVTVEARGEDLKYQWYFRNKGATRWTKSTVRDNTYDDVMNNTRNGREVYCVITDLAGNQVTTDIVKLVRVPMKLEITAQPADATAAFGDQFCVTVAAKGEGLKYQWYYRNSNSLIWHKSGVRDNTYDDEMTKARNGREIYCVITDKHGNSVTTDTAKLIAVPSVELKVLGVTYESAAMGERYCVTVEAEGDGLTYQWYFRNAGSSKWYKSSVRDNTYDDVMTKARANREVYCVITDAFGNRITTEVVTLALDK